MPIIIKKCKFHTRKTNFVKFIIELKQINIVCTNLMVQVSRVQGHEIRLVLYAYLDGGDHLLY